MLWSASVLVGPPVVLGAAIGLVVGRVGWWAIARERALDQPPISAWPWIAVVIVGGLTLANMVAWLPARRGAHTPAATVLRAE